MFATRTTVRALRALSPLQQALPSSAPGGAALVCSPGHQAVRYSSRSRRRRAHGHTNTVINFVPQQEAWVVERFGKFETVLEPGLRLLWPFIDTIKYVHTLKELVIEIPSQSGITRDNVTLHLDGVIYMKVEDPYEASYGVEDPEYAVSQLAQTTMRSELGQLTLDAVFKERAQLNTNIVEAINQAAEPWGITCLRCEIKDISLPDKVIEDMQRQVSAERRKRASVLESEGSRESAINIAEGAKRAEVLASEAEQQRQVNQALGEASAIRAKAEATAEAIKVVAEAIEGSGGSEAVALRVADNYIEAFGNIAKEGTTVLLPADMSNPAGMIATALSLYDKSNK